MKPTALSTQNFDRLERSLRGERTPFAVATVVRTLDATSATDIRAGRAVKG